MLEENRGTIPRGLKGNEHLPQVGVYPAAALRSGQTMGDWPLSVTRQVWVGGKAGEGGHEVF